MRSVTSPVLLLIFNRPDTTRRVFDAIRAAKPARLYVAADGPRVDREGEAQRCREARLIATAVDWPCEVRTLFRQNNLGCMDGVHGGISWFFEQESEGIILEDDVLPVPSFFGFCDELLARYKDDDRVGMISASNFVADRLNTQSSYIFSRYTPIWGWATWRRAWRHYDVTMAEWPRWRDEGGLSRMPGGNRPFESYWRHVFDSAHAGKLNTWDWQWQFACWRRGSLTILPRVNQTQNLGFGAGATHSINAAPAYVTNSTPLLLEFPLVHPHAVEHDLQADAAIDAVVFGINHWSSIRRRLVVLLKFLLTTFKPKDRAAS